MFAFGGSYLTGATYANPLNDSTLTSNETGYTGGVFGTGISFTRWASLTFVGLGLPADTPGWISTAYFAWQAIFLTFVVGWFISAIWNG